MSNALHQLRVDAAHASDETDDRDELDELHRGDHLLEPRSNLLNVRRVRRCRRLLHSTSSALNAKMALARSGWVSVGIDHDTAQFAVSSITRWRKAMGRKAYPNAARLMITADSSRSRL